MSEYEIKSIEDLKRANSAAQSAGSQVTNYADWLNIMQDLEIAGVESTGSYAGDKAKLEEVKKTIEEYLEQREARGSQQVVSKDISESDKQQTVKANVANAMSSTIIADYMKYYHLLS